MARYLIMSDIHGNLQALESVVSDAIRDSERYAGVFLLGDLIDYGMQTNEVVEFMKHEFEARVGARVLASIWGNHERAIMKSDFSGFSSERGVQSAKYTASILTGATKVYLEAEMKHTGMHELDVDGKRVLMVHGSLKDPYWGAVMPEDVQDTMNIREDSIVVDGTVTYSDFDIVVSGHTHFSHVFTKFYKCEDESLRNKKATVFINPGSVGQPRNRNPHAQYAVWDSATGQVELRAVEYDVAKTMSLYYGQVDVFYRDRLKLGV